MPCKCVNSLFVFFCYFICYFFFLFITLFVLCNFCFFSVCVLLAIKKKNNIQQKFLFLKQNIIITNTTQWILLSINSLCIYMYQKLVGDNVDHDILVGVQTKTYTNRSIHWTYQYAVLDRVQAPELEKKQSQKLLSTPW